MYTMKIKTKYNTITLKTDDYNKPEIQEILEQPYIEEVKIEQDKIEQNKTIEQLIEERDKALWHVVGTSYWNEVAHEKNKQILKLKKSIE